MFPFIFLLGSSYIRIESFLPSNWPCAFLEQVLIQNGFPGWLSGKEPACQSRSCNRLRFNSWVGKTPGGGKGNPLHCSCLENSMDRGAWWATVHGISWQVTVHGGHKELNMTKRLSMYVLRNLHFIPQSMESL